MVDKESALLYLPEEDQVSVHQNHSNMAKFTMDNDEAYRAVVRNLNEGLKGINCNGMKAA